MSTLNKGSCLCGAVTFTVAPPFTQFHYCHCSRCRKSTGSAHAANIFAKPENLQWLSGAEHIKQFELADSKGYARAFCTHCGSPLPYDFGGQGKLLIVPAGTLDDDPGIKPEDNIFWQDKAPWFEQAASLPCFDRYPK